MAVKYFYLYMTVYVNQNYTPGFKKWCCNLLLSLMSPAIVQIFNVLTMTIVKYMNSKENRISKSYIKLSAMKKVIWLQFFHSAAFPLGLWFLSHRGMFDELIDRSGDSFKNMDFVRSHIFWVQLVNVIFTPVMSTIDLPHYISQMIKRKDAQTELKKSHSNKYSKKDINVMYEKDEFPTEMALANYIRTYFIACFFLDIVPMGTFFAYYSW